MLVGSRCVSAMNFRIDDSLFGMEPRRMSGSVCVLALHMPEANIQARNCGVETFCDLHCVKPVFLQVERS
jgi:hypothetical protein